LHQPHETISSLAVVLLNIAGKYLERKGVKTMIQRIIKVGKNLVLPLPEEAIESLQLSEGAEVIVVVNRAQNQILIQPVGLIPDVGEIDQVFAGQVSAFIKDYKPALDELAKLKE
jgi:antitoxin component of MazEF toxin-antitoxin module